MIFAFALAVAVGATAIALIVLLAPRFWPTEWEPAAQATLAAAVVGLVGALVGVLLAPPAKWVLDQVSLHTKHQLAVRSQVLVRFHDYAATYLYPFHSASGDLSTYLMEFDQAQRRQREDEALDGAFYALARYTYFYHVLSGQIAPRETSRPEGIFLSSRDGEDLVWKLCIRLWAFGVRTIRDEAVLVNELVRIDGSFESADQYLEKINNTSLLIGTTATLKTVFSGFARTMAIGHQELRDIATVLRVLCAVLGHELWRVWTPWYGSQARLPRQTFKPIKNIPQSRLQRIGVSYE